MLGRSLLLNTPAPPTKKRKASTVGGGAKGHGAAAGNEGALPVHLQAQMLCLLTQLLRSGRRLTPRAPVLLEEEFSLLAPDAVRLAIAAAKATATGLSDEIVAKSGAARGGSGGGGRGGGTGNGSAGVATSTDVVVRSVALLEELQMGSVPPTRLSADGDGSDDDGGVLGRDDRDGLAHDGGRIGMRLRLEDALALSEAVEAMVESGSTSPPFDGHGLKMRVMALLASPGAVDASATVTTLATARVDSAHRGLPERARAITHGESHATGTASSLTLRSARSDAEEYGRTAAGEALVPAGDGGVPMRILPQTNSSGETTGNSSRKKKKRSRVKQ